jgi:hypothetical protein
VKGKLFVAEAGKANWPKSAKDGLRVFEVVVEASLRRD